MKQTEIAERQVWVHQTTERSEWVIIQPVDEHDIQGLDEEVAYLKEHTANTFTLVAFRISNWNVELSPWAAPTLFGREDFGDGAAKTLSYVLDELIPRFKGNRYCLGGYSLAGLFALWSGYQTDVFSSIVGASPSVWFPSWIEYTGSHQMKANRVYLSLGDKEPKAKKRGSSENKDELVRVLSSRDRGRPTVNPVMARVGECIEQMHNLLECEKILEWNEGNHFKDNALRTAKGLAWAVR